MVNGLWIVNSSLVVVLFVFFVLGSFLKQEVPPIRIKQVDTKKIGKTIEKKTVSADKKVGEVESDISKVWEKIYTDDIFEKIVQPESNVSKPSLITPIPEPKSPTVAPLPEIAKIDFIDPLNIKIKGLIVSADENKSIAMIADETEKEDNYHLGDKIKDAQIIKIAQNRIVLMRPNGQHETFYLRKEDMPGALDNKWNGVIKKIDDKNYEVDPDSFKKEIDSLGNFIERISVVGTAYSNGVPFGIRIGKLVPEGIGPALGLVDSDIIVSINDLPTSEVKNRIKIYDLVSSTKIGGVVNVVINRSGAEERFSYKLVKLEKPRGPIEFSQPSSKTNPADKFKMNRGQMREKNIRAFEKQHGNRQNNKTVMDIRKRLLDNLHARLKNARVR